MHKKTKKIAATSIGKFGWRSYRLMVPPQAAADRLGRCPLPSLREKLTIDPADLENLVRYRAGLGGDETECARWILANKVPDERLLTPENAEAIFQWVRETA